MFRQYLIKMAVNKCNSYPRCRIEVFGLLVTFSLTAATFSGARAGFLTCVSDPVSWSLLPIALSVDRSFRPKLQKQKSPGAKVAESLFRCGLQIPLSNKLAGIQYNPHSYPNIFHPSGWSRIFGTFV